MTSPPSLLRWQDAPWVSAGALINIDRAFYPPGFHFPHHTHDYAEFFLIERGPGEHHHRGRAEALSSGDCAFIHPDCIHHLAASAGHSLRFTNIAIRGDVFADLAQRYRGHWPWPTPAQTRIHRLPERDLDLLQRLITDCERRGAVDDPLVIHGVIAAALQLTSASQRSADQPAWLRSIIDDVPDPRILAGGVAELATQSGYSREHVNRLVRRHCGCTARRLITRLRLRHAAALLRASEAPITTIAAESGFANLANFYRLFGREFGLPPKRYRDRDAGFV